METTTDPPHDVILDQHVVDITLYAFSIFLFGIACYVFLVLCIYLHRFLQKRRRSPATSYVLANGFGSIALAMRFVAASISFLCFAHFIFEQILLHSNCCDPAMEKISQFIYGFVLMLSYLFFWLRQRVLYDAPAMRLFNTTFLRALSWLSLGFVVVNSAAQIITTCLLSSLSNPTWVYLSWLIGCIIVQGCLMALFLYPLLKHGNERRRVLASQVKKKQKFTINKAPKRTLRPSESNGVENGIRDSNIFTVSASKSRNGSSTSMKRSTLAPANPMYRAARRCVVCAAVAFTTDVIAGVTMIVAYYTNWDTHEADDVMRFLFDLNLAVNSIFVVGCFANWRYILLPECFRAATKRDQFTLPTDESEASPPRRVITNNGYLEQ